MARFAEARSLDAADPLAFARERFALPEGVIYLDGNSLGALPTATSDRIREVERQWGDDLIASWKKHGWIDWPTRIAAKLSPIVGAKPNELLIADSTSVCLFKLLAAAVRARPRREDDPHARRRNFPTDLYVAQGLAEMLGLTLKAVEPDEVIDAIDGDTAVVTLTHVDYRSRGLPRHARRQRGRARRRRFGRLGPVAQRRRGRARPQRHRLPNSPSAAATNI